jgi:hypothetical protein
MTLTVHYIAKSTFDFFKLILLDLGGLEYNF